MNIETDPVIAEAQAKLEARRRAEGIAPQTAESARAAAGYTAGKLARREESIADVLGRTLALADLPPPPPPTAEQEAADRAHRIAEARADAAIPDRHRGATWANLGDLVGPDGAPALSGVLTESGKPLRGLGAVADIRRRLAAGPDRALLLGATRAGKSVTAAAALDCWIRNGGERVRWVSALALREPAQMARALGARVLVVDNVGAELFGAGPMTGLCAQRCQPFAELVDAWSETKGKRLIATTFLTFEGFTVGTRFVPGIAELYGGNTASRLFEGATQIQIGATL